MVIYKFERLCQVDSDNTSIHEQETNVFHALLLSPILYVYLFSGLSTIDKLPNFMRNWLKKSKTAKCTFLYEYRGRRKN